MDSYTLTFTYANEDGMSGSESVHDNVSLQSARDLASFNMGNDGLVSILIVVNK